jgi:hypothetical protein
MTTGNGWKSIARIARDDSLTGELFDAEDAILVRAPEGEGPPTDEVRDRDPAISVARAESRRLRVRARATAALGRLRVRRGEDERKRVDLGRVVPQNKERHGRRGWHGRTESRSVCVCCCCLSSLSLVDVMVRGRRLSSSSGQLPPRSSSSSSFGVAALRPKSVRPANVERAASQPPLSAVSSSSSSPIPSHSFLLKQLGDQCVSRSESCLSGLMLTQLRAASVCGIIGLLLNDIEAAYTSAAATEVAEGLSLLQHRSVLTLLLATSYWRRRPALWADCESPVTWFARPLPAPPTQWPGPSFPRSRPPSAPVG